ncbi:hypothetical protein JCM19240_4326 [Vibrio maritimus]|uniref:Uncharacterized protein n=1 Tax=Vibrio maritimus TaxID=990268 RepID=A0A090T4A1_9VIBR|nr:hypothetical protein JCM19240_4326 [Vibrio maritimus]
MQSVNSGMSAPTNQLGSAAANTIKQADSSGNTLPTPQGERGGDSVSISPQAKALFEQEKSATPKPNTADKSTDKDDDMGKTVTSFAHGALGMDHPDDLEEQKDTSYSAGQYVSAAVTVGALILALV